MRRAPRASSRRAMAMVLVLAALVIGVTAAVAAARVAVDAALIRRLDACEASADDAMVAAEKRIDAWLRTESGSAVVDPSSTEPAVAVERVRLATAQGEVAIRITAFDQLGMVPWSAAAKDEPLARATLDEDVRAAIARAPRIAEGAPGVDLVAESLPCPRWPRHAAMDETLLAGAEPSPDSDETRAQPALAALVSSHAEGRVRLNVNTAPIALLEAAQAALQADFVDSVRAARADGRAHGAPSVPAAQPGARGESIALVASSDLWSFRVDIACGPVVRSWWIAYGRTPDGWQRLQRTRIEP